MACSTCGNKKKQLVQIQKGSRKKWVCPDCIGTWQSKGWRRVADVD